MVGSVWTVEYAWHAVLIPPHQADTNTAACKNEIVADQISPWCDGGVLIISYHTEEELTLSGRVVIDETRVVFRSAVGQVGRPD